MNYKFTNKWILELLERLFYTISLGFTFIRLIVFIIILIDIRL